MTDMEIHGDNMAFNTICRQKFRMAFRWHSGFFTIGKRNSVIFKWSGVLNEEKTRDTVAYWGRAFPQKKEVHNYSKCGWEGIMGAGALHCASAL